MSLSKRTATTLVLGLAVTGGLWAQRGGGGMMGGMPSLPGLSNPTVGSGSEYLVTSKGKEMDVTTVALGKEDVDGAAGFWMETRMTSPDGSGEMVMKMLTVSTGPQPGVKRMIMQRPGQPPMEMPTMMMSMMQQHQPHPTPSGAGEQPTEVSWLARNRSPSPPARFHASTTTSRNSTARLTCGFPRM